ncbi:acetylornithine transaminase [Salirhabdus salicampi]|uniref:acetylornithine transaminase n=1 Tax=Salirhabdus salicampi TaxID=476102 RepID=UPI0020C4C87E|nr:acetylornithine transaminase [Salirhabdus salicampi]MCP8617320.1 acetylornithine transaminase [Salirhabdus salicampi]
MAKVDTSPIMKTYNRFPVTLVKGKGSYVWDDKGNKYLDYTAGIATCNLGHVPEEIRGKVMEQFDQLWHCSNLYHIPAQQQLAELLVEYSCFDQVFFCNSGAEANEAAIKLARKYAHDQGKEEGEIVTFTQSFHGRTMATLSATGQKKIQHGFTPLLTGFRHEPFNDMEALEKIIQPDTIAVLLELVQGEGGVMVANSEWVQKLATLCKQHDVLLIVDEVQTGIGRTGSLFAYEQYDIEPDIITLAKGLGSGIPIGAILAKEEVAQSFQPGSHGSTFGGNPLAATAGLETVKYLAKEEHQLTIKKNILYFHNELRDIKDKFSLIKEVRGKGLLLGLAVEGNALDIISLIREMGVLVLPAGPNVIRILPPLNTTKAEIDYFVHQLSEALEAKSKAI